MSNEVQKTGLRAFLISFVLTVFVFGTVVLSVLLLLQNQQTASNVGANKDSSAGLSLKKESHTTLYYAALNTATPDTFILVRYDGDDDKIYVAALPKSFQCDGVPLASYHTDGLQAVKNALATELNIPIQNAAFLARSDLALVLSTLGKVGITLNERLTYRDPVSGFSFTLEKGEQNLDENTVVGLLSGTSQLNEADTLSLNADLITEYILQGADFLSEDTDNLFFNTLLNCAYNDLNSVVTAKSINILKDLMKKTDSFAATVKLHFNEQDGYPVPDAQNDEILETYFR